MKKIFLILLVILCITGCGNSAGEEIKFGTGGAGGKYFHYGSTLSKMMADENNSINLAVKNTAGSAANLRLLREDFLDLAIVQSDMLADAVTGTGIFSSVGKGAGYAAVGALYTETCQIIVADDSDIKTVFDLVNKKVSVGEKESGTLKNAEQILAAYGLSIELLQPSYLSFADSAKALERGEINAFFCTAGTPTDAVSSLANRMKIRLIEISPEVLNNLVKIYPGYNLGKIPAGTYKNQTEEISALNVKAVLMANTKLNDDIVANITEFIFKNSNEICSTVKIADTLNFDYATKNISSAFHSGAAKYYKQNGVEVEIYRGGNSQTVKAGQD